MKTRVSCRVCDGSLETIMSLGEHYVSNFPSPGESYGSKAPLELVLCLRCRLLQLKVHCSGTNRMIREALTDIANKVYKWELISFQDSCV